MNPMLRRILIAIVATLAVAAVVVIFLKFFVAKPPAPVAPANAPAAGALPASNVNRPAGSASANVPTGANLGQFFKPREASAAEKLLTALQVAARDFAERYGSYSSDGNSANLEALLPVMTDSFRSQTEAVIVKNRALPPSSFVGATTRALSAKPVGTVSVDAPAKVIVSTQRTENSGGKITITYRDLELTFQYSQGLWKADGAVWR